MRVKLIAEQAAYQAERDFAEGRYDPESNPHVRREGLRLTALPGHEDVARVWTDAYVGKWLSLTNA